MTESPPMCGSPAKFVLTRPLDDDQHDLKGNGFLAGAGLELRFNAVIASMSVFADYTIHRATLESTFDKVDATAGMLTVGVTVGL